MREIAKRQILSLKKRSITMPHRKRIYENHIIRILESENESLSLAQIGFLDIMRNNKNQKTITKIEKKKEIIDYSILEDEIKEFKNIDISIEETRKKLIDKQKYLEANHIINEYRKENKNKGESVVYFIYANFVELVKIGFTSHIKRRIKTLNRMSPIDLVILKTIKGSLELERKIHDKFKMFRVKGEWFEYNNIIKKFIERL